MHETTAPEARFSQAWFAQLAGTWSIQRRIVQATDALPQVVAARPIGLKSGARLRGSAYFEQRDANTLAYREEGLLRLGDGKVVNAVRKYLYRLMDGALVIYFDDGPNQGERFLRLDPCIGSGMDMGGSNEGRDLLLADNHLCGRDLYQAEYQFKGFAFPASKGQTAGREQIVQRTSVSGPRKDYAIVSILRRA